MARRRVNLRFVITLSVVLVVAGGGGAGALGIWYMRSTDPMRLKAQGDEALAKNPPDIETALVAYQRAKARITPSTPLSASQLSMTIGDLFYQTSDQDPARYWVSLRWWNEALMQDKKFKPALERMLKERYLIAEFMSTPGNWQDLEQNATSLINLDGKNGLAYEYRGEAILRQIVNTDLTRERREAAQADLNKAMELLPGEPMAYSLSARLRMEDARQHDIGGRKQEAKKARDEAFALMQGFCDRNPNNATGWALLASLHIENKQNDEAGKCFETALKIAPNDPKIYGMMGRFMVGRQNGEAEKAFRRAVELSPNDAEALCNLAGLYQGMRRPADAIDCYKKVLDLRGMVAGIQGAKMQQLVPQAMYWLSTLYMETVEAMGMSGAQTPAGKEAMQQANLYTDKLRGLWTNNPLLFLLEGRMLLIRDRNAEALGQLKRAEEILSRDRKNDPRWRTTRLLMATAYARIKETGQAMQCIDEILRSYPGDPGVTLQKAKLSLQLNNLDDAIKSANMVLDRDPENIEAKRTKAMALRQQGNVKGYEELMRGLNDLQSELAEARIDVLTGQSQAALALLLPILEKNPEDLTPLRYAIICYRQMAAQASADKKEDEAKKNVEEAKKLLAQGLAKSPHDTWFQLVLKSLENPAAKAQDLELDVIKGIPDPYERAMAFWQFYAAQGDMDAKLRFDNQIKYLKEAEAAKPEDPQVVEKIFAIALATKDLEMAAKYAQKAERLNLDAVNGKMYLGRLQLVRADKWRAEGKTKEANAETAAGLSTLQSAVLSRPDYSVLRTYYGFALRETGRPDQAKEELQKAVEQRPDNVFALKGLIGLCMARGDEASQRLGLAYLKQALSYARMDPELISYDDMYGDPNEGIRRREAISKARPEDMDNLRRLAMLFIRANQPLQAIERLKPVLAKFPNDLALADQMARLYRDTDQSALGLKMYDPFLDKSVEPQVQCAALLLRGDMYRSLGQNTEAVLMYRNAIDKQPKGINEAQRRLADLCFDTEDLANAEKAYKRLYEEDKTHDMRILRRYVETLIREGKFDEAMAMLAGVLKENPRDPQGLVLRGNALLRQRQAAGTGSDDVAAEAIKCFNMVLEDDPNNLDALHYRAFSQFFMQGDTQKAIADLIKVRQIAPGAVNSRLLLARVYRQSRKYAEAVKEYQETLSLDPTLMQARLELSDFLFTLSESYQRLAPNAQDPYSLQLRTIKPVEILNNLLSDSVKRFPTQPIWQIQMGELASVIGNKDAAMAIYQKVYQENGRNPQFAAPYLQGLATQKNFDRVIEESTKILANNPNAVDLYVQRGTAYAQQAKQTEALADLDKALTLTAKDVPSSLAVVRKFYRAMPKGALSTALRARLAANAQDIPTRVGLGQALISDDQPSQAVQVVAPLMEDPNAKALQVVTLRMLALAYYQNSEFQKSLANYEALLKFVPDDLEVLNNLAFLLAEDLKRPADALVYAERAVKVLKSRPMEIAYVNNGNVLDTYGWIKFLNNDESGAIEELARSLQTDPLPITYYHMAQVLKKQKRIPEAKKNLQLAIELAKQRQDPILGQAEELLRRLADGTPVESTQK